MSQSPLSSCGPPTSRSCSSHLGRKAIVTLVLLRLCVGWHFFSEGTKKLTYDQGQDSWRISFSAASFFSQAKGPLAGLYKSLIPGGHQWQTLLAVPKQAVPRSSDEQYQQEDEIAKYNQRRKKAIAEKSPMPIEFPTFAPYHAWASHVVDHWRIKLKTFTDLPGLTETQKSQAAKQFVLRHQQLADYLADEFESIEDYQHNLWRLEKEQAHRGTDEIPYLEQRLLTQQAEITRSPRSWVATVQGFETEFQDNLMNIAASQEKGNSTDLSQAKSVLTDPKEKRMVWLSLAVTCVVTGVGICLLLGFLTPLAACLGAFFLLSVISTQPPWIAGSAPIINQAIELTALLVLAATSAGRWAGLDYFLHSLCNLCCSKS